MKRIFRSKGIALVVVIGAAYGFLVPMLRAEDSTYTIEVATAAGILKFHGRNETQYREMRSGIASLTSGSFLRTGNGTADIVLPYGSVLSLDANTEIQVGMYRNGIMLVQRSGRAWHHVVEREGMTYAVQLPYAVITAIGTIFHTYVNWPVNGTVTVVAGEVGVVLRTVIRDQEVDVYGFVPTGQKYVWAAHRDADGRVAEGEMEILYVKDTGVAGKKSTPPPDDSWVTRNRGLSRQIRQLERQRRAGQLTEEAYRQKLSALLGIGPRLIPNQPLNLEGSLWSGMIDAGDVIKFCVTGTQLDMVSYVGEMYCYDKTTEPNEHYQHWVNLTLGAGVPFFVDASGHVDGGFTFPDGVYKDVTIELYGYLGGSDGQIAVSMYSENDVASCIGRYAIFHVRRAPSPCVR